MLILNLLPSFNIICLRRHCTGVFNTVQIYKGYVDDPRNTDNAWMETVAINFHDETGDQISQFPLSAGRFAYVCEQCGSRVLVFWGCNKTS